MVAMFLASSLVLIVLRTAPAIGTAKCISYTAGIFGANTDTYVHKQNKEQKKTLKMMIRYVKKSKENPRTKIDELTTSFFPTLRDRRESARRQQRS
jgi:hypothetical protein